MLFRTHRFPPHAVGNKRKWIDRRRVANKPNQTTWLCFAWGGRHNPMDDAVCQGGGNGPLLACFFCYSMGTLGHQGQLPEVRGDSTM